MRFIGDMGISSGVINWLRSTGHDALHLRDLGLQRLPDNQIFDKAFDERRIVLTFDLDFGEILAHSRGRVVSVVLFRLNNATTPFVIDRLKLVLPSIEEALEAGAIVVVEDARHRIRRLPF